MADLSLLTTEAVNALTAASLDDKLPEPLRRVIETIDPLALRVGIGLSYTENKAEVARSLKMTPDALYKKMSENQIFAEQVETVRRLMLEHLVGHALGIGQLLIQKHFVKAVIVKLQGLDSVDERVRQKTASEIIDRFVGKPAAVKKEETGSSGNTMIYINAGIDPAMLRDNGEE